MKNVIKKYSFFLKILSVTLVLIYLVYKLWNSSIYSEFKYIKVQNINLIFLAFSLMFINWGFEAKKWQIQIQSLQKTTFINAFKAILAGLSSGLLTPNRLGNFIGRLSFINKDNRHEATLQTLLGNLAQFISTIVFGLIGLFCYLLMELNIKYIEYIISVAFLLIGLALVLYFNPAFLNTYFSRFFSDKTILSIQKVSDEAYSKKIIILALSMLRYFVFCLQYLLLFFALNSSINLILILTLISITYLITTIIPSPLFGKFFVRESVAIFVFSLANINISTILVVTFILWLINLALPAILGSVFWLKQKHV